MGVWLPPADPPFIGVVSDTGTRIHFDQDRQFRAWLQRHAATEIVAWFAPRPRPQSQRQRGYWFGVIVDHMWRELGYESKRMAHDGLKAYLMTLPFEVAPSFSELDSAETHDVIERACALLAAEFGYAVPEADPDPRRRWEASMR